MPENINTSESFLLIKNFIINYREKEENLISLKMMHEIPIEKNFLRNFIQIEDIALKLIENEAPKFNLFDIITINHLEARVHTPFLASLLNPDGTHRQGRLFFNAFMKHLFVDNVNNESINNIDVSTEVYDYDNGRMDIVISYREAVIFKKIIIENKIYHHDGKQQLENYYNSLTKTHNLKTGQYHLIYLTPYGKKPSIESISKKTYDKLIQEKSLTEWSYYDDITSIFDAVKDKIKAPVVSETINQYIKTIQNL